MSSIRLTIDRLRRGEHSSRATWLVLGPAMAIATAVILYFGRNTWFSIDEAQWISDSPDLGIGGALEPHVGHLVFIPRLVYKLLVSTVGIDYAAYRVLTVVAILLCAGLFFTWARRRVPDFVALAFSLPILLFSYDPLHLIAGNGFTVVMALAFGIAALIAWDRDDLAGDIAAFAFLILGVLTYTVALPFAAGLAFAALLERRWDRAWVGAVPLFLYLLWRLLGDVSATDTAAGGNDPLNILLLPAWSFGGISGVLGSWSGLNFNFATSGTVPPGTGVGPALAIPALAALGWRIATRGAGTRLWTVIAIALALFAAQTIALGGIERYPDMPRYLYPGLIVVLLIVAEAARGFSWSRGAFIALWLMTAISLMTAFMLLRDQHELRVLKGEQTRAEVTAVTLLGQTPSPPPVERQPRRLLTDNFDPVSGARYGSLGFDPSTLKDKPAPLGNSVDRFLFDSLKLGFQPYTGPISRTDCRPLEETGGRFRMWLPRRGAVVTGTHDAKVWIGRFGSGRQLQLGKVGPNSPQLIKLRYDGEPTPWFVKSKSGGVAVCPIEPESQ